MKHVYERMVWGDKLRAIKNIPGEEIKKRRIYYLALHTLTVDDDGICWGEIYNTKGKFIGNFRLDIFKNIARHIYFKAKEVFFD